MITIQPLQSVPKPKHSQETKFKVIQLLESIVSSSDEKFLKRPRRDPIDFEFIYRNHDLICKQDILDLAEKIEFKLTGIEELLSEYDRYYDKVVLLTNVALFEELELDLMQIFKKWFTTFDLKLVFKELDMVRNGTVGHENLKRVFELYQTLNLYFSTVEPLLVAKSVDYYNSKIEEFLQLEPRDTVHLLSELVSKEKEFICKSTLNLLGQKYSELLHSNITAVIDKCIELISSPPDFGLLVGLCEKCGSKSILASKIQDYIKKQPLQVFVGDLLELKSKLYYLQKDAVFDESIKTAFSDILEQQKDSSEQLVYYIDKLLKKKETEMRVESTLSECLSLFRLLKGKDLFEAFYGKTLAKRLLLEKSASVDAEKSMLLKLKTECGPGFTKKLEGMFRDMELSRDIMAGFSESKSFAEITEMDFNVHVLTSGFWPTYPTVELILPETGKKELILSLYQAIVLLLFNEHHRLTAQEIQEKSKLESTDLNRTLQSLSLAKIKILTKTPMTREVALTDVFELNDSFKHPLFRIIVNQIQAKETKEEIQQTTDRCFEDRLYMVDAAIVRIMKQEKRISYKELVTNLFETLKFPLQAADVKKRIESLLERDYMERDAQDATMYSYVA